MIWLDWNSIVNSRHGITDSLKVQYKFSRSLWSSIEDILPPFPLVKKTWWFDHNVWCKSKDTSINKI